MVVLYTAAAFLSATLLFAVQPLATRMVLPDFGGSAAVWTTSVLFFQGALLLGYLYTHVATTRLAPRTQVVVHLVLFVVPAVALPLSVAADPGGGSTLETVGRLLAGLAVGVGAPFFLVSTSGPLLQRWFSWSPHARAQDPYFLYAASNVGSILGLLTYPVLVEPALDVAAQARWWTGGYVLLGLFLLAAAWWVRPEPASEDAATATAPDEVPAAREGLRTVGPWVGLSFLPSSLMLGVTTFLSTDIAAVPLLWVLPLAVYLATFVVAFSRWSGPVARVSRRLAAPVTVLAAVGHLARILPLAVTVALAILSFGTIAMVIHDRLAARRPPVERLTAFYVWISVGGALGGLANGVLAPVLLPGPFEFAVVGLVAAAAVGIGLDELVGGPRGVAFWSAGLGVPAAVLALGLAIVRLGLPRTALVSAAAVVVAGLFVLPAGRSKLAVVSAVALLALPGVGAYLTGGQVTRSFFGSYRVVTSDDGLRSLYSGSTLHGLQSLDPALADTPLSYYHPDGPVGDWLPHSVEDAAIGVVGLGAGSIAAYTTEGQVVRFHEIDPTVVDLAEEQFTFLADAAGTVEVVLGDGRLTVADLPDGTYDVLVVDAFSSDSIPVHLLTREAFEVYRDALTEDGVLLVHVSNRYLDLEPVVAAGADAVHMAVRTGRDGSGDEGRRAASVWMALTADARALSGLDPERWTAPSARPVAWTDAFSNLVGVLAD